MIDMKPVFKCEYCSKMGTEEEIKEHEPNCLDNYDKRSCYTCMHKKIKTKDGECFLECEAGCKIPKGKFFEFCTSYERKEKPETIGDFFSDFLGFKL